MPPPVRLLIVDDDASLRATLSAVFKARGYGVITAADGFSALAALAQHATQLIISDLNMPGMSGFEFLSVVRRRFPAIAIIAMSGAFQGVPVPTGISADAFYEKGSGLTALLDIASALAVPDSMQHPVHSRERATGPAVWVSRSGYHVNGQAHALICCIHCLRPFLVSLNESVAEMHEAVCTACNQPVQYGIIEDVLVNPMAPVFASEQPSQA